jgi:hypothetical protein
MEGLATSGNSFSLIYIVISGISVVFMMKLVGNKAGTSLLLLLMVASFGFNRLRDSSKTGEQPIAQPNAAIQASQMSDGSGVITVRTLDGKDTLFQYFQSHNAAQLVEVRQLNPTEWIAVFLSGASGPAPVKIDQRYKGWFESQLPDTEHALPLVRRFQSIGGAIRVEDEATQETLFSYQLNGSYKPVAVVTQDANRGMRGWQILFSSQTGLASEQKTK